MAISQTAIPVLCLVCFLLAHDAGGQEENLTPVRVDSALFLQGMVVLFSGQKVLAIKNFTEHETDDDLDSHWLDGDAAYGAAYMSYDGLRIFLYGKNQSELMNLATQSFHFNEYNSTRKFLNAGAPDAAAKRDGKRYFFRGCKMAIKHKVFRWSKVKDVRKFGLPCNMDAAWYEPDEKRMVILRGNQIWFWGDDGSVVGPQPFADTYTIKSWVLEPYSES